MLYRIGACETIPYTVTVYRHGTHLTFSYPLMCNVKLEYTTTHLVYWVIPDRVIHPRPVTHAANALLYIAVIVASSQTLGRKPAVPSEWRKSDVTCESSTLSARPQLLLSSRIEQFRI